MKFNQVRQFSLSLPMVTEQPHHQYSSFRVNGKIFVTVPPEEKHIHVFVDEQQRELALVIDPEFLEKLYWGQKVVGVKVALPKAKVRVVKQLIAQAWVRKAPKSVVAKAVQDKLIRPI